MNSVLYGFDSANARGGWVGILSMGGPVQDNQSLSQSLTHIHTHTHTLSVLVHVTLTLETSNDGGVKIRRGSYIRLLR